MLVASINFYLHLLLHCVDRSVSILAVFCLSTFRSLIFYSSHTVSVKITHHQLSFVDFSASGATLAGPSHWNAKVTRWDAVRHALPQYSAS